MEILLKKTFKLIVMEKTILKQHLELQSVLEKCLSKCSDSIFRLTEIVYQSSNSDLPNPRVVNGFRICPLSFLCSDNVSRVVWYIRPNKSVRIFYFKDLKSAENFAISFSNNHNDSFWFKRWNRFFSISEVSKHLKVTR